ncbi:MAG: hypothetical protein KDN05_00455 [Verrucomicrobiae bacterium]|nr:hypothetical protein [Verrucomicrobiae bacterium]
MKPKVKLVTLPAILTTCAVVGCVPADQTIAVVNAQTRAANSELAAERGRTRDLLQTRKSLESQLATLRARKSSLEASDPVGNRDEINRINREIASMERHLRMQL